MEVFDFEHHYNDPGFMGYLKTRTEPPYIDDEGVVWYRDGFGMPASSEGFNLASLEEEITDLGELRIQIMDQGKVTRAIVSPSTGVEDIPREESIKYAKATNDAIAAACKRYPDRLIGAITLPAQDVEASLEELDRAVNELGLLYWHTHSNFLGSYLYEEKYEPLLARCEELGIPVYLHPNYPDCDYMLENGPSIAYATFGFTVDTTRTALVLIKNGLFDRHPNLQIILGHAGEFLTYGMTRMDGRIFGFIKDFEDVKMEQSITTYFKRRNILTTTSGIYDPHVIQFLIDEYGPDIVLFATDYPYEVFSDAYDCIDEMDISDEVKEMIFHGNADRYIFKKPEAIAKYGDRPEIPALISDEAADALMREATGATDAEGVKAGLTEKADEVIPGLQAKGVSLRQLAHAMEVPRWRLRRFF